MEKKFLIDTNILLEYLGNILPDNAGKFVDESISVDFNISVINRMEILGHTSATAQLEDFLNLANQYELSNEVVAHTIGLRKIYKIKLPDAIIAATALVHSLILISRNAKDLKKVKDLKVINPYEVQENIK